jgi:hypothetical protein
MPLFIPIAEASICLPVQPITLLSVSSFFHRSMAIRFSLFGGGNRVLGESSLVSCRKSGEDRSHALCTRSVGEPATSLLSNWKTCRHFVADEIEPQNPSVPLP